MFTLPIQFCIHQNVFMLYIPYLDKNNTPTHNSSNKMVAIANQHIHLSIVNIPK